MIVEMREMRSWERLNCCEVSSVRHAMVMVSEAGKLEHWLPRFWLGTLVRERIKLAF